jgi:hypothetical protein
MCPAEVVVLVAAPHLLILARVLLCERVGHVTVGSADERREAQLIPEVVRSVVETQEPSGSVATVVQVVEVHRVQEAVRARGVQRAESGVVPRATAQGQACFVGGGAGRAAVDVAVKRRAETGLRDQVHDRTDLLAVLGGNAAEDDLHGLRNARIDGVRERHAGLVGYGLAVDHELALAVGALEVVTAVLVLREARRRGDELLHGSRRHRSRRPSDVGLVEVDVRRRGVRLELRRRALSADGDALGHRGQLERNLHFHRQRRANLDSAPDAQEALDLELKLVRVPRHVEELEGTIGARERLGLEPADVVLEPQRHAGGRLALRVEDVATDRARARRRVCQGHGCEQAERRHAQRENEMGFPDQHPVLCISTPGA